MKTILLLVSFFVSVTIRAQVFYGTANNGGSNKAGVICKLDAGDNSLTSVFSFDGKDGMGPSDNGLREAADGKLYGTTPSGGNNDAGTIYSLNPATSVYTKLYNFDYATGSNSYETLLYAGDGKFYGTAAYGGNNGSGVIFSFDPVTSTYTKLYDFDGTDGANSYGSLVEASDGKFYGLTAYGGSNGYGVIFSFDPSTSTYTKLYDFDDANGSNPDGCLVEATDGKLYGLAVSGGSNGKGVIFSFGPATSTFTKMYDLSDADGSNPAGRLLLAADSKLYGMTMQGGDDNAGTIFSIDPASSTYTKLHDFDGTDGSYPYSYLLQAPDGKLYGVTTDGGNDGAGVIFSIDPVTAAYNTLHDFDGTNGRSPNAGFVLAADGKLYATAYLGGSEGSGIIFSYDISGSVFTTVRSFGTNNTGSYINGGLIKDNGNNLYGITYEGGAYGHGAVFSFNALTSTYTKLHDFNLTDGAHGEGHLLLASDSKLYGMTAGGGTNSKGVVFSIDPANSAYVRLKDLDEESGNEPSGGGLIQAPDGKLYGMTAYGGSNNAGVIFSIDPGSSTYTKLYDFDVTNGGVPNGSLVQGSDGNLYGLTTNGGSSDAGVIFSFNAAAAIYTKLYDFEWANGNFPFGSLMQGSDGNLYGMTAYGTSNEVGVIFSFNTATATYTKLYEFDGANGSQPYGSLVQASDGKLYGMTPQGGSMGYGVSFSYDLSTLTYTKLAEFDDANNGANPYYTYFTELCLNITYYHDADGDGFGDINDPLVSCSSTPPEGYVTDSSDCDDSKTGVHPGAVEICGNGIDDNCNGQVDEGCTAPGRQISIISRLVKENNKGEKIVSVKVQVNTKHPNKTISVDYTTTDGSATAGSDYTPKSGTLIFDPGIKEILLPVTIIGDRISEANETFNVVLSNPVNAAIAVSTAVITIEDNDAALVPLAIAKADAITATSRTIGITPNPAKDKVNVMLTGYSGKVAIQIINMQGKALQQKKIQVSAKFAQEQMNIEGYAAGIYLVTATDELGRKQTQKLVIAR